MKRNLTLNLFLAILITVLFTVFTPPGYSEEIKAEYDDFDDPFDDEKEVIDNTYVIHTNISDPLEPLNRGIFYFNDKVYLYLLIPVSKGYGAVLPKGLRRSFSNFFSNLSSSVRFASCLLQGKFSEAGIELKRFTINTTIGLLGFFDPATKKYKLSKQDEDMGQTFGHYGIDEGFFLMLPFLGPSSARDSIGLIGNAYLHPITYIYGFEEIVQLKVFEVLNETSMDPDGYKNLKKDMFDPYIAFRDGYVQLRRNKVKK